MQFERGILNIFSSYRDKTIKSEQLDGYSEIRIYLMN